MSANGDRAANPTLAQPARKREVSAMGNGVLSMRETNEVISEGTSGRHDGQSVAFVCECDDPTCFQAISLTRSEFDEACARPGWRALAPRHHAAA